MLESTQKTKTNTQTAKYKQDWGPLSFSLFLSLSLNQARTQIIQLFKGNESRIIFAIASPTVFGLSWLYTNHNTWSTGTESLLEGATTSNKTGSSGGELRAVDTQAWPRAVIQCPWQYIVEELSDRRRTRILKMVQTQKAVILPFHHPTSSHLSQTSCCPSRDFLLFNDAFVFISANSISQPNKERKLQAVKCCNWTLKAS